jgi:hypothetical protein
MSKFTFKPHQPTSILESLFGIMIVRQSLFLDKRSYGSEAIGP